MNFHTLEEDDFPPELQKDWRWVMDQLTKFGPIYGQKGEIRFGSVEHTMRRVKKKTGVRIAEKLVDLYEALRILDDE
jgi:hypothetical protein